MEVLGLISHLAVADEEDKAYTFKQLQEFSGLVATARSQGWALPLNHLSNSAALWEHKEAHLDLVRPGLMLYGSPPSPRRPPPITLKPVMTLATEVLQVKRLPSGEQHQLRMHLHHPRLVRPGGAAGGLLQRLQPAAVQPGRRPGPTAGGPPSGAGSA